LNSSGQKQLGYVYTPAGSSKTGVRPAICDSVTTFTSDRPKANIKAQNFYYDAAGRLFRNIDTATNRTVDYRPSYDGDGKSASEWSQTTQNGYPSPATSSYIVRSTVLRGEILTRLNQNGNKSTTYVPAEGLLFATQETAYGGGPYVRWTQRNPLGITETGNGVYDPLGNYIPFQQHDDPRPPAGSYNSSSMSGVAASLAANPFGSDTGCIMDGLPTPCSRVLRAINNGQADKVTVYGFSTSLELSLFTASYSAVTTTGSRYRLPPTTTYKDDNGNQYVAYGQPPPASEAAVQFVIIPGFQLSFVPTPQNPTQTTRTPELDCHIFADRVQTIGENTTLIASKATGQRADVYDLRGFLDELARAFVGATDSSINSMRRAGDTGVQPPNTFTSAGFQSQFADPDNGNQVRHYTAGLIAAFNSSSAIALRYMNSRETPGTRDYASDTALNAVSTRHGGSFTPLMNPKVLADWIRRDVCTPR
jgi:hypothetical protein